MAPIVMSLDVDGVRGGRIGVGSLAERVLSSENGKGSRSGREPNLSLQGRVVVNILRESQGSGTPGAAFER